jgi:hypothetical protein
VLSTNFCRWAVGAATVLGSDSRRRCGARNIRNKVSVTTPDAAVGNLCCVRCHVSPLKAMAATQLQLSGWSGHGSGAGLGLATGRISEVAARTYDGGSWGGGGGWSGAGAAGADRSGLERPARSRATLKARRICGRLRPGRGKVQRERPTIGWGWRGRGVLWRGACETDCERRRRWEGCHIWETTPSGIMHLILV